MGASITVGTREELLAQMVALSSHKRQGEYVCFVNVHMLMESSKDSELCRIINSSAICCPDGVPVAKSLSWVSGIHQRHFPGPDALPKLLSAADRLKKRIFLVGGTDAMMHRFMDRAQREYPDAEICGYDCPPFQAGTPNVDTALVNRINSLRADMIFVALGCPKQEKWMSAHVNLLNGCMFGVGYAIPVYAGMARRAPRWMIEHGLEWCFRLYIQPKRLFWRYLKTNSMFINQVLKLTIQRHLSI